MGGLAGWGLALQNLSSVVWSYCKTSYFILFTYLFILQNFFLEMIGCNVPHSFPKGLGNTRDHESCSVWLLAERRDPSLFPSLFPGPLTNPWGACSPPPSFGAGSPPVLWVCCGQTALLSPRPALASEQWASPLSLPSLFFHLPF